MLVESYLTALVAAKARNDSEFENFITDCINRHFSGDYGETCPEDVEVNQLDPLSAMSAYTYKDETKIWVKQENDIILVLFPNEY